MAPHFFLCVLVGILMFQFGSSLALGSRSCEDGFYYSLIDKRCLKCSSCPNNQIIKIPCSEYADLKCGPFNFNDFPESGLELSDHASIDLFDEENDDDEYYTINPKKRKHSRVTSHNEDMESHTAMEKEDREYWKTLAFALIGLLSVLIIVATVVVLLACRKLQRATVVKQPDEGEMDDADSGYVVIRSIKIVSDTRPGNADLSFYTKEEYEAHPPLLGAASSDTDLASVRETASTTPHQRRLCFLPKIYKPQRRLLNYDADDVFESDDSGSSFIVPGRNRLQTNIEMTPDFKVNNPGHKENSVEDLKKKNVIA